MTEIDNKQKAVSQFLTETATCPRQTQGGKIINCKIDYHPDTRRMLQRFKLYDDVSLRRCPFCGEDIYTEPSIQEQRLHTAKLEAELEELNRKLEQKQQEAKSKKHQSYDLGPREFTFTYSPKWMTDEEAQEQMTKAIRNLIKIYRDEIIELKAVGEYDKSGKSHLHCYYHLQGGLKITDKNFKRQWKYWDPKKPQGKGFQGGHHETVKSISDFKGYIEEDIQAGTHWLEIKHPHNIGTTTHSQSDEAR